MQHGMNEFVIVFFFQAEDGIRDYKVTGVQTCALPILLRDAEVGWVRLSCRWEVGVVEEKSKIRSEEHTSELQSPCNLVCRLLLEKKNSTLAVSFFNPARFYAIFLNCITLSRTTSARNA